MEESPGVAVAAGDGKSGHGNNGCKEAEARFGEDERVEGDLGQGSGGAFIGGGSGKSGRGGVWGGGDNTGHGWESR